MLQNRIPSAVQMCSSTKKFPFYRLIQICGHVSFLFFSLSILTSLFLPFFLFLSLLSLWSCPSLSFLSSFPSLPPPPFCSSCSYLLFLPYKYNLWIVWTFCNSVETYRIVSFMELHCFHLWFASFFTCISSVCTRMALLPTKYLHM